MKHKTRYLAGFLTGFLLMAAGCTVQTAETLSETLSRPAGQAAWEKTSAAAAEEPEILIKLATTKLENSTAFQGLEMFKEIVEQETGGAVEIILYPNGQLGDQTVIAQALELGTIEMGFVPIESTEEIFPKIAAFPTMFLIEDEEQVLRIWEGEYGQKILSELQDATGIVCLGQYLEGMRQVFTVEEIHSLSQLQGQTIRVPQLPMVTTLFQSLGASVTFMPFSQVYDGLRTGVATGVEIDAETFLDYQLYEVCKYGLKTNHAVTVYAFMIQEQVMKQMTQEQQQAVAGAADQVSQWLIQQHTRSTEDIYQELEEKGVKISVPTDRRNPEMVERIEETLMEYLEGYITWEELEALREY